MASEQGHIINVSNLKKARDYAVSMGASYQPSHPDLLVAAMATLITASEASMDAVQSKVTPWRNATAAADDMFKPLSNLASRIQRAAKGCGLTASFLDDLDTPARKLKGQRATPKQADDQPSGGVVPLPPVPGGGGDGTPPKKNVSASQMSRQQRIEHLDQMRNMLAAQPLYTPNETDLKLTSLGTLSTGLQTAVDGISTTYASLSQARSGRNDNLYLDTTNVVRTGQLFKAYIESAFGRKSAEWNAIKGLTFRDLS